MYNSTKKIKLNGGIKMKEFYILFKHKGRDICGCWKEGKDEDEAISKASWGLICNYPNVSFDETLVTNKR